MKRVLLVDDEALVLAGLARALRRSGVEITSMANGEDAIRAIGGGGFDLCFLDVRLPGVSGLHVLAHIRKHCSGTKVAVISASDLTREEVAVIEGSADYFLEKPFDLARVREISEQVLFARPREVI